MNKSNNFSSVDLTSSSFGEDLTSFNGYSNASGSTAATSVANLAKQIEELSAKITALTEEAAKKKQENDFLEPRIKGSTVCGSNRNQRTWQSTSGEWWCGWDSTELYNGGVQKFNANKSRMEAINKLVQDYNNQIDSLKKQMDSIGSNDPEVVKAKAAAEVEIKKAESQAAVVSQAAKSKSDTVKIIAIAAASLLVVGGLIFGVMKFRKTA